MESCPASCWGEFVVQMAEKSAYKRMPALQALKAGQPRQEQQQTIAGVTRRAAMIHQGAGHCQKKGRMAKASARAARQLMQAECSHLSTSLAKLQALLPMLNGIPVQNETFLACLCLAGHWLRVTVGCMCGEVLRWTAQALWEALEGAEAAAGHAMRSDWRSLHRKLVARRCRLAADLQQVFGIRPRAGLWRPAALKLLLLISCTPYAESIA